MVIVQAALLELGDPCARIASLSVGDGVSIDSAAEQEYLMRFFAANSVEAKECVPWAADSDPCADRWTGVVCGRFASASVVKELHLAHSRLVVVPASFSNLNFLEAVDFQHNLLVDVPESLPETLKKLQLARNRIRTIADSLKMMSIEELDLAHNQLTELPEWFGGIGLPLTTALGALDLEYNFLTDLPPHFCDSHSQEESQRQWRGFELDMQHNSFVNVPATLGHCTDLAVLNLGSNEIRSVPASMGTIVMLERLLMDNNDIETVAEEIGQLIRLSYLDLSNNQIGSLPGSVSGLYRLTTLKLGSNSFEVVPEGVRGMVLLEHLDISDNQLVALPGWIGNTPAATLQYLSVRNNKLTALPVELSQLGMLQVLQADGNFLHGVPGSIMRLYDSGSLVQLTVCQEAAGSEIQRDGRCECGTGTFGSGPNCMACAEVEEDELVDVACPSGPTADARSDPDYIGNYLTAIYPGPGYWLNQSDIDDQLKDVTAGQDLVLPDLECNGKSKFCVGTDVDRDWSHSVDDGRGVFRGFCQGTRKNDETNATCMQLVGLVGEDTTIVGCVQPPFFCAANHAGRFW
jgi:Leucine-rich repeat (LRR) protein